MSSTDILQTGYITETDADVRAALHKEEASILPEPHSENLCSAEYIMASRMSFGRPVTLQKQSLPIHWLAYPGS